MALKSKSVDISIEDALNTISAALERQAELPNMLAYKPHDKQKPFHASTSKKKLYIGGNRSGKTTAGIVEDLWWATGRHPYRQLPKGGVRGRIVSVDFVNGIEKIIFPQIKQWIIPSDLEGGSWENAYDKQLRVLSFKNGSFIEFMSYDQDLDKFAGTSRHFIHFDEEPPEDIYTECLARLVDTNGSFWITMTPIDGMTWIFETLYEPGLNGERDIFIIEVSMTDNPHLNAEAVQNFLDGLTPDERTAREHGRFVQLGGLIYKEFKMETHVKPSWTPPKDWLWVVSMDHGYNNPSAWLWHGVSHDGAVVTFYEHYQAGWTVELHAAEVRRLNEQFGRIPDFYIGDPAISQENAVNGTSIYVEYVKRGIPIVLGNNDVKSGIDRVSRYLKVRSDGNPNWTITEDCPNLIKEIRKYRWKTYANKRVANANNLKEEPHKKDDHAMDSARYFFMSRPDLRASTPELPSPINQVGAIRTSAGPLRAEPMRDDRKRNSDYNSGGDWVVDDMGDMW